MRNYICQYQLKQAIQYAFESCYLQFQFIKNTTNRKSEMKDQQICSLQAHGLQFQDQQFLKCLVFPGNQNLNLTAVAQKLSQQISNTTKSVKKCQSEQLKCFSHGPAHITNINWTAEQTNVLFELFRKYGSRWTKISNQIKGKSQNCIKNRFYGSIRKALRKLNKASKNLVKKFKKQLKYESITRIIDASQGLFRLQSPLKEESQYLTNKILLLAQRTDEQMAACQAEQMIISINRFNMATRSYKSVKKIKNTSSNKSDSKSLVKKSTNCSYSYQCDLSPIDGVNEKQENIEYQASSTNQQNHALGKIIPDRDQQIRKESEIEDLCEQLKGQYQRKQSILNLQDYFEQIQSPLECEAWL